MSKVAVTVYSAEGCVECDQVKELLKNEGIGFEVKDVMKDEKAQKEVESFGFMGIPVTVIEGKAVKGLTPELRAMIGQLK